MILSFFIFSCFVCFFIHSQKPTQTRVDHACHVLQVRREKHISFTQPIRPFCKQKADNLPGLHVLRFSHDLGQACTFLMSAIESCSSLTSDIEGCTSFTSDMDGLTSLMSATESRTSLTSDLEDRTSLTSDLEGHTPLTTDLEGRLLS